MLRAILSEARGQALSSIVRTIQAQQDELIRADDSVVVVQGAAGTGKTVVALHRLAYLLYAARSSSQSPGEDLEPYYPASRRSVSDRSTSRLKVAVFGPNRTYLRHIRAVLPSLGERDAVETTFEEWVGGLPGGDSRSPLVPTDDLEHMLDASMLREQREHLFRRARVKGSLEMGRLLKRYASLLLSEKLGSLNTTLASPQWGSADGRAV